MRVISSSGSLAVLALLGIALSCGGEEFTSDANTGGNAGSSGDGAGGNSGADGSVGKGGGDGAGGSSGTSGSSGTGGEQGGSSGTGPTGGSGGSPSGGSGGNPTGGSGGNPSGGSGGNPTGGSGGSLGSGGKGGSLGSGGSGGSLGSGGSGGSLGSGGKGGSLGSGGSGGKGGSLGSGGKGGSLGSGGGGGVSQECRVDSDCTLYGDCCTCTGLTPNQAPPSCAISCAVSQCTAMGITNATCYKGQCISNADCDLSHAVCGAPIPSCAPGTVNTVVGPCYGPCVDPTDCRYVASCDLCRDSQICVTYSEAGYPVQQRCLEVPAPCQSARSCGCLDSYACVDSYQQCSAGAQGLKCDCPAC